MRIDDETRLFNKDPKIPEMMKQGRTSIGSSKDGLTHRDLERSAENNPLKSGSQDDLRQAIQKTRRPYIQMLIRNRVPLMDIVRQARAFETVPESPYSQAVKSAGVYRVGQVAGRLEDSSQPRYRVRR